MDTDFGKAAFHFDLRLGDFYKVAISSDSRRGPNEYISQAYFIWKPIGPIRIEAGKVFSSVGAEVPQSDLNFNITRSYCSGMRARYTMPASGAAPRSVTGSRMGRRC